MGQHQSSEKKQKRRRSTALAAGFVTGTSGKVEEKYNIDVSGLFVLSSCLSTTGGTEFFFVNFSASCFLIFALSYYV